MGDELCEGPRVGHCIGGEELLPSDKEEGVKALPFPEGGMVNAKFEAHIKCTQTMSALYSYYVQTMRMYIFHTMGMMCNTMCILCYANLSKVGKTSFALRKRKSF